MRIEGTEARQVSKSAINNTNTTVNEVKNSSSKDASAKESINRKNSNQQVVDLYEYPLSDKAVIQAIERANEAISIANRRFEYSIHEKTKEIIVKVIDADTDEVIREIPPEKILDMVAKMWELAGILVDERR